MFACDITVSVLEDEDGRFVDLDGEVGLRGCEGVVDVGLSIRQGGNEMQIVIVLSTIVERRVWNESTDFFPRANASIDLVDNLSANHLVENDPGTRIQDLFVGSSV